MFTEDIKRKSHALPTTFEEFFMDKRRVTRLSSEKIEVRKLFILVGLKIKKLTARFGIFSFFFWMSCATTPPPPIEDALLPEIDVIQVKENSDEAMRLSRESKLDIDALNTKLLEVDNRLLIIGEELANVSAAKIEELENRIAILSEEFRLLEDEFKSEKELRQISSGSLKNTFTPNPTPSKDAPVIHESEASTYKLASDFFYARDYEKAIRQYEKIIKDFPNGTYADNSVYWKGESHFALGNYAKAIAAYQKVFTYANSEKSDDSQFKIALGYARMGDRKQAITEFEKLISLYPDSEYMGRAKQELRKLK